MLISQSKIHHINTMLITMLKSTYPNKNLCSINTVPYFFLWCLFKSVLKCREERSSLSLKHYLRCRLCRTDVYGTGNPLHKKVKVLLKRNFAV